MRPSRRANSLSATVEAVPSRLPKPFFMTWTIPEAPSWVHTGSLGSRSSVRKLRPTYSLRATRKNPETRAISGFIHSTAPPRVTHRSPRQLVVMALMALRVVDSRLWSKGWSNSPTKIHNSLLYGLVAYSNVWTSGMGPPTALAIDSRRKSSQSVGGGDFSLITTTMLSPSSFDGWAGTDDSMLLIEYRSSRLS